TLCCYWFCHAPSRRRQDWGTGSGCCGHLAGWATAGLEELGRKGVVAESAELERDGRPELLVLRALKLGDLLVAVPALRALRAAYPEHRILYAAQAWLRPVLELTGSVD